MYEHYAGFRRFDALREHGYALEAHFDLLKHVMLTREGCVHVPGAGRGGIYRFDCAGRAAFLRVYRRGGVVRHFIRESYLLENRALAEFRVHHHLQAQGFPVAELAGIVWRRIGLIYRGAFATFALEGQSLLDLVRGGGTPGDLVACGALIARLHALGVYHADLNVANIFLTPRGPHLLDFDRALLFPGAVDQPLCDENLARLKRSCTKQGFPPEIHAAIAAGYRESIRRG